MLNLGLELLKFLTLIKLEGALVRFVVLTTLGEADIEYLNEKHDTFKI